MKTSIEIADGLFEQIQALARKEKTTIRALTERGLRLVLAKKRPRTSRPLPPLVTVKGNGLTRRFKQGNWDEIRNETNRREL